MVSSIQRRLDTDLGNNNLNKWSWEPAKVRALYMDQFLFTRRLQRFL